MRFIILTIALLFSLNSFCQDYIFEDTNIEWNTNDMTIKGEIDGVKFNGKLTSQKIGYAEYNVLESSTGSFALRYSSLPSKYKDKSLVYRVYISSNSLKDLVKAIKKKNFAKLSMKYEKELGYVLNKEIYAMKVKAQEQLEKNIQTYGGVYKVEIVKSSGISFENQYGKLYILEEGISLKTEIYSMERISGSYKIPITNEIDEGMFSGNLGKGTLLYDNFTLTINDEATAAGLTLATESYSAFDTTTMIIVEKISGLD